MDSANIRPKVRLQKPSLTQGLRLRQSIYQGKHLPPTCILCQHPVPAGLWLMCCGKVLDLRGLIVCWRAIRIPSC